MVGFSMADLRSGEWIREAMRIGESGEVPHRQEFLAVRGQRLALTRLEIRTEDESPGAPQDEVLALFGLDDKGRIALQIFFDVEDVDAAIAELDAAHARFEEPPARPQLENAASRVADQVDDFATSHRWDELGALFADDMRGVDRRRGFSSEYSGRATAIVESQAIAEAGVENITSHVVAVRGERLALARVLASGPDGRPSSYGVELLRIIEIDSADQVARYVTFDLDDIDAAFEELDARYLAGEAAAYAHAWSVISQAYAALNQHEIPPTTLDWVNIDHRRIVAIEKGDVNEYLGAAWDAAPHTSMHIKVVHRLSDIGALVTYMSHATSEEGLEAEWEGLNLLTIDGDLFNRAEIFDEADIDAAIARFEQLSRPTRRLENAASQVVERYLALFASRDWDAMAAMLADDIYNDDRRRVVNAGVRHGRDTEIANVKVIAEVGCADITSIAIATRGERLVLARHHFSMSDWPEEFQNEMVDVVEINADNQISSQVIFDAEDIDAAFEELDARYLAGEAAAYADTWSVIARAFAAMSRREVAGTTPNWVNIDHRRRAFAPGDATETLLAMWDLAPNFAMRIETVHRLTDLGAVITNAAHGKSQEGFDAEWRSVNLLTVEGDLLNRCEIFDETDIDAAIASFDQLSRPMRRLENAANRVLERYFAHFTAREWDAMAETLADDFMTDDRRRVVNAGIRHGRDAEITNMRAFAEIGILDITLTVMATRGERLVLVRDYLSVRDWSESSRSGISVMEINADNQISAHVLFDVDSIDAAFAELDARYLAGEAAPYSRVWQTAIDLLGEVNRHEPGPIIKGLTYADHRRVPFGSSDFGRAVEELWTLVPDARYRVTAVHALEAHGIVASLVIEGADAHGNELQWSRLISLQSDGPRMDVYEEDDRDIALARFEELRPRARRLENAASRVTESVQASLAARDWDAIAEILADDISDDDRRRVVNAGTRRGRQAEVDNMRAVADLGAALTTSDVIAIRGERLALMRMRLSIRDQDTGASDTESLNVVEIDTDDRIAAIVTFEVDDVDAAFEELDARYLAGEAAAHAPAWALIARAYAGFNRGEHDPTSLVNIDHRRATRLAPE